MQNVHARPWGERRQEWVIPLVITALAITVVATIIAAVVVVTIATTVVAVRAQFFTFQISTFDKSGFSRALIIAWQSHHSPYPLLYFYPLTIYTSRRTRTRTEHSQLDRSIPELSKDNDNKLVLQDI